MYYSKIKNNKLVLSMDADYKYHYGLLIISILLVFIPIVNLLSMCYLFPKALYESNLCKARTAIYEQLCEGEITDLYTENGVYHVASQSEDGYAQQHGEMISATENKFYLLPLIGIGSILLELFVSNIFGIIGFGIIGVLSNTLAQQQARNVVIQELMCHLELQVVFPDTEKFTLHVNTEED